MFSSELEPSIKSWKFVSDSVRGIRKNENQDGISIISLEEYSLFFVFDGVGSALNAKYAVDFCIKFISNNHARYFHSNSYDIAALLISLNSDLFKSNKQEALTTFCLVCLNHKIKQATISNLGDSRIYAFSNQYIKLLSVDDGIPGTNRITNCLGIKHIISREELHIKEIAYFSTSFLICTDGFYHVLETNLARFFRILNYKHLNRAPREISKEVFNKNRDDSTYIILK